MLKLGFIQARPWAYTFMNLLTIYSVLTVERCDNKLPHKKGPSKLPFTLINCGKISFNFHFISFKIAVHILFIVKSVFPKDLEPMLPPLYSDMSLLRGFFPVIRGLMTRSRGLLFSFGIVFTLTSLSRVILQVSCYYYFISDVKIFRQLYQIITFVELGV